jgi:hypothetical protein
LLADFGWATVNAVLFPTVLVAALSLGWLRWRDRAQAAAV